MLRVDVYLYTRNRRRRAGGVVAAEEHQCLTRTKVLEEEAKA